MSLLSLSGNVDYIEIITIRTISTLNRRWHLQGANDETCPLKHYTFPVFVFFQDLVAFVGHVHDIQLN